MRATGPGGMEYSGCGFITDVGGQPTADGRKFLQDTVLPRETKAPARLLDEVLVGYATVYRKAHMGRAGVEIMNTGCFSGSLRSRASVAFLKNHSWARCYGSTGSGELELHDSDEGLAFKLHPAADDDGRQLIEDVRDGRLQMSVGFEDARHDTRMIDDTEVKFINEARLMEISAVEKPAVKETSITILSAHNFGSLAEACRSGRMKSLAAAGAFERASARLRRLLAG